MAEIGRTVENLRAQREERRRPPTRGWKPATKFRHRSTENVGTAARAHPEPQAVEAEVSTVTSRREPAARITSRSIALLNIVNKVLSRGFVLEQIKVMNLSPAVRAWLNNQFDEIAE